MSVTPEQQKLFIVEFKPWAQSAANQLNIDPDIVLAQWALESLWGTIHPPCNVAGITRPDGVVYSFPGWAQMVQVYVASMRNDCPNILHKAVSPTSPATFVFEGTRYNTVNPAYASTVAEIAAQIEQMESTLPASERVSETDETAHPAQVATPPKQEAPAPAPAPVEQPQTMAVKVVVASGVSFPAFIVPTTAELGNAGTEVVTEQFGILVLKGLGYTDEDIQKYLVQYFGYSPAVAASESAQGYPVLKQTASLYKKINSVEVWTVDGQTQTIANVRAVYVTYSDGTNETIG